MFGYAFCVGGHEETSLIKHLLVKKDIDLKLISKIHVSRGRGILGVPLRWGLSKKTARKSAITEEGEEVTEPILLGLEILDRMWNRSCIYQKAKNERKKN